LGGAAAGLLATPLTRSPTLASVSAPGHAMALHGEPALPDGFARFPYADPSARRGGRLVYGEQGTFDSLNALIVKGNSSSAVDRFVLQRLMMRSFDEPFSMYGLLARRVELSDDGARLVFHLAEKACFADGAPLTAADVAFTFALLKDQGRPFFRAVAAEVRAVTVVDARTIAFNLTGSRNHEAPLNLAQMPILPRHATDVANFSNTTLKGQLGSGPYRLAEVRPGSTIILRRNPNFWADELPQLEGFYNFDEIRYEYYRDANSLFEAFKTGALDVRLETEPARWLQGYDFPAARDGRIVRETIPIRVPAGVNGYAFNTRRDIFADIRVRRALTLLFDFEWTNANLFFGAYRRIAGYFDGSALSSIGRPASASERALLAPYREEIPDAVIEGSWRPAATDGSGRDRAIEQQALSLLEASGWLARSGRMTSPKGDPLAFEIMATSQAQERLALNYASSLARVGITARVRRVDEVQFWRRMQRFDFDMAQYNWAGSPAPGNELPNRWSAAAAARQGSLNYPGIRSKMVDAMLDKVLSASGLEDYADAVRALDRALIAGSWILPLYQAPDIWLARAARVQRPAYVPLLGFSLETLWQSG